MGEAATREHYSKTAYVGGQQNAEPWHCCQHGFLFRKSWTMGAPLTRSARASGLFPPRFLTRWSPEGFRLRHRTHEEEIRERGKRPGRLDEECIQYATLPKSSWSLLLLQIAGRLGFWIFLPAYLITEVVRWAQLSSEMAFGVFLSKSAIPAFLGIVLPFILCWFAGWLLERYFPTVIYTSIPGPKWELNRRTGMVTIYHEPGSKHNGEVHTQAPFREWDGYILSLPDRQGNIWHRLVLVHRIHEWALPMNHLIASTTNKPDVLACWDVIHQYMDVKQPLPDMPLFEPYRHLDPTTRKHDKDTGRDPNYWRNMDDEAYKAFQVENHKKIWQYNWE